MSDKAINPLLFLKNIFLLFASVYVSGCAVNPRCPTQLMPVVEVQINNTPSNHDDYVRTTTFIPCRARIANASKTFSSGLNFPGGVEVEVRNKKLSSDLTITPVSSGSSTQIFATLPGNGDWFNFFIRGNTASTLDKSVVLELATAGATCSESVLTRKALMVSNSPPIPAGRPQVEIQVGGISCLDDYINWAPTYCRIRWINPPNSTATMNVTLRNMPATNRLRFSSIAPGAGTTATNATINLALAGDNNWTNFYIAGNNGNPSINDKDAVFEVLQTSTNDLLAREGVMVRIRKNVNALTATERDNYLEALRDVHQTYNFYMLFRNSHSRDGDFNNVAHRQAHRGSAFLPWHRAFVLHFERLLQNSDPSVVIPYWHFDHSSPNMFHANFIGSNTTTNFANLSATNPIVSWQIPGETIGIRRRTPYGDSGLPGSVSGSGVGVETEIATLALGVDYENFKTMERLTHNGAHTNSSRGGSNSWIGALPSIAPQDPLFFLLHSNIDRLWAKWQWVNGRYEPTQVETYDLQQSHDSPPAGLEPVYTLNADNRITSNRTLGQYLNDSLWPWDNVTGGTGTAQRPSVAPLTPFPITLEGLFPGSKPTIKSVIDFRQINFSYDDIYPY